MTDPDGEDGPSYSTLLGRVMKDGERFAKTRLKLYRALFYYRVDQAKPPVIAAICALFFAAGGFIALALGLVLALAQLTGALLAGIIVFAAMLGIAAGLGYFAVRRMPDLTELPFEEDDLISYEKPPVPDELLEPAERGPVEP